MFSYEDSESSVAPATEDIKSGAEKGAKEDPPSYNEHSDRPRDRAEPAKTT